MKSMEISDENKIFLKTLLYLAPPIIFQEIMAASVNIIDAIMIGNSMGIHEIAAVGLSNQIFFIFAVIVFATNGGLSVFVGQFWGKKDKESIHKVMGIAFIFNTIMAATFFSLAFFIPETLISIYSDDPIVIELGARYLRLVSFSYFFVAISFTRNSAMRAIGQTRIPMVSTSITLFCNFVFNYISIFVLGLGLGGVAVGTVIARFLELIIQQIFIYRYKLPIQAGLKNYFLFDKSFVLSFFKVSKFITFSGIIWSVGTSTYNIAYGNIGTEAQAAVQISSAMMQLFQVFGTSLAITTSIMVSNTLGKGDIPLAIRYSRKCIYSNIAISTVMAMFLILMSPLIIGFYNLEDPRVAFYVSRVLYVVSIGMILRMVNFTSLVGILRSGGDTKFVFFVDLISVWGIGVPLAFLGAVHLNLPIYFVVLLVHMEEVFKAVASIIRVRSNKWAKTIV